MSPRSRRIVPASARISRSPPKPGMRVDGHANQKHVHVNEVARDASIQLPDSSDQSLFARSIFGTRRNRSRKVFASSRSISCASL